MALDLRGFYNEPNQWSGLYHAADQLEKRQLRADQLALQREGRRAAAGTFLHNYLDPKDYLTGTQFDPLLLQGLEEASRQGSALAAAGADSPTLMMALGPMVNKLNAYSAKAKAINKQADDYIGKMKESGLIGYDFAKLKDEALRGAFYKADAQGQLQLDPDKADPSVNWVEKAIELNPEKVTTTVGWDTFADKAKMKEEGGSETNYDRFGNMDKHGVNLKYQEYMVPEWEGNKVKGFVPKYQTAVDGGNPIMHSFTGPDGKPVKAAARILDASIYDGLPKSLRDYLRGQAKMHIQEYESATGEKIPLNSPKAKLVEQALGYDELNRPQRNFGTVKPVDIINKPSPAMVNLRVQQTGEYLQNEKDKAAARKEGRVSVVDPNSPNLYKRNAGEVLADIYTGKEDLSKNSTGKLNGTFFTLGGNSRNVKDLPVIDVTSSMPDGGLKAGSAADFKFKKSFYAPGEKTFIIEKEYKKSGNKKSIQYLEVPEADYEKFINNIAEPNSMNKAGNPALFNKVGYSNGKFGGAAAPVQTEQTPKGDFDNRKKKIGWRKGLINTLSSPFGQPTQ